jgi:3-oxoacyl-[acyl-carrier protein] reductase
VRKYATDGITINALTPAVIRTSFQDTQPQHVIDYITARIPMNRAGTIEDIAEMITFMVAPACGFTTVVDSMPRAVAQYRPGPDVPVLR